jgi:superfamily I DNA/RNA helicase
MTSSAADAVIAALVRTVRDSGLDVVLADGYGRPDLLILDPRCGVIAVDFSEDKTPDPEGLKLLNRKIAQVSTELPELDELPVHGRILCANAPNMNVKYFLPSSAATNLSWISDIPSASFDRGVLTMAVTELDSAVSFTMGRRTAVDDSGAQERATKRVSLDQDQSNAAIRKVDDVLLVTGPAGSGKSLVLVARARWLAAQHPDWRIQILCYNKALVSYLRSLVKAHENVEVETFGRFAYNLGHRFAFEDSQKADLDFKLANRKGIEISVDAMLIDESQDFFDGWLKFASECIFPGRGGIVVAGDDQQALYRESSAREALAGHKIDEVRLRIPYRSTREILEVVSALTPDLEVDGHGDALSGEPVELVWAESITEQARALTTDLRILNAQGRPWSDMCMLVTQKFMIGPVVGSMKREGVPCEVVNTHNSLLLDLSTDTVKVLTVHSSKGLEFGVVCLLGLEQLKDPSAKDVDLDEKAGRERSSRLCLVGPTRARDLLFISYTKNSVFLERLRSSKAPFRAWTWPDDYEMSS